MKINKIIKRSGLVVTCLAGVILTGCATHPGGKTDPHAWITQCNLTPKEQQCLLTVKKKYDAMTTAQQHNVITWFKDHYKRQSMWKRAGKKSCPRMTQQNLSSIYRKVDLCVITRQHDVLASSDYGRPAEQDVRHWKDATLYAGAGSVRDACAGKARGTVECPYALVGVVAQEYYGEGACKLGTAVCENLRLWGVFAKETGHAGGASADDVEAFKKWNAARSVDTTKGKNRGWMIKSMQKQKIFRTLPKWQKKKIRKKMKERKA